MRCVCSCRIIEILDGSLDAGIAVDEPDEVNELRTKRPLRSGSAPCHSQEVRDAAGVLAIRLHHHGRQGRLHVARLEQHGLVTSLHERRMQPLRQGKGVQADPR